MAEAGRPTEGGEYAAVVVAKALSHPTRIRILMAMTTPPRRLSPMEFTRMTDGKLSGVSYHFRGLAEAGCIELVDVVPRRGSTEHYYEPKKKALAWAKEWEALGPAVRQTLAASVLRGAVESIGRSIDGGSFEARPNSHLSWDTMRVDDQGWSKATAVMDRALTELMDIEAESLRRCEDDRGKMFLGSFLMSLFESPPERD